MASKSVKKTCKYVYRQGPNKGKKCQKTCRAVYCCDHNPKKQQYFSKRFQDKKKAEVIFKNHEKVNKILETPLENLPSLDEAYAKLKELGADRILLRKKMMGLQEYLGNDITSDIKTMERLVFGKCTCCDMTCNDISNDELEEAKDDPQITAYADNDNEIKESLLRLYKCVYCERYSKHECKFCSRPLRTIYIRYNGKSKEVATKKVKRTQFKIDKAADKYKLQQQIIEVLKKRYNEIK